MSMDGSTAIPHTASDLVFELTPESMSELPSKLMFELTFELTGATR